MGEYLKLIRDMAGILLIGVLALYALFVTVCCIWFGMSPITFIQVFHFDKEVSVMPDNISSSSSAVLEIGDTWEEGTLFAVQVQAIEEISLEAFQAINDNRFATVTSEDDMRAFQVNITLDNINYTGIETTAYGYVDGMYAIVHVFGETTGPLLGTLGELGITKSVDGGVTAIPKGGEEERSYAFLVPDGENEIKIAIEILDEENGKNLYRKEYRYSMPGKDET